MNNFVNGGLVGLSSAEAARLLEKHGKNELSPQKKDSLPKKILHVAREPMFLLLLAAAVIYFLLGEPRDGAIMLIFVAGVMGIEAFQEWKTDKTLNALKSLSAPRAVVIRDGIEIEIPSAELVPGDVMLIREGVKIPADGIIIKCSDLCVDESTLTGEPVGVWKEATGEAANTDDYWKKDRCYAGTLVIQGTGAVLAEKTGAATEFGKIGESVASAPDRPTPLEKQTGKLVKLCAGLAAVLFILVAVSTYFNIPDHELLDRIIESVLSGITLSMAMIPEEFPVILAVFLSMGAWRLAKNNSLVRRLSSVETLGAVSVLCVDKTGTLTLNQMTVQDVWAPGGGTEELCEIMGLACETDAYDPMEKAMLAYCESRGISREHLFGGNLINEYSFTNETKMMAHVWRHDGEIIIAAKGSPEGILEICGLSPEERALAEQKIIEMSQEGLRVIAVGMAKPDDENAAPDEITKLNLNFCGLVGLSDPPRETVAKDIAQCIKAGIRVVMITGDGGITAASIARKIGMPVGDGMMTGDELDTLTDEELREKIKKVNVFSRVVPGHKMRIVKAFRDNGEVVAMTGDGVNDAAALKYADIGIAMGKRGSEVSREAADIILMDDNFTTIVDTVKDGRRIYDNIRKAVGYVFAIHIPIALASLFAPLINIDPADLLLLPLHVVLLELVIDPTCSVVLERQPPERNLMNRPPRDPGEKLITAKALLKSVIQGLIIFAASFGSYRYMLLNSSGADAARTMGLAVIILANLFLVQVNASDCDFAFQSAKRMFKDKVMLIANAATLAGLLLIIYTPLNGFLKLAALSAPQFFMSAALACVSVIWYEGVKLVKKLNKKRAGENE